MMLSVSLTSSGCLVSLMIYFTNIFSDFIDTPIAPANILNSLNDFSIIFSPVSSKGSGELSHFIHPIQRKVTPGKRIFAGPLISNLVKQVKQMLAEHWIGEYGKTALNT